jgi:hypothetical protein
MSDDSAAPPLLYVYRPSVLGAPYEFRLDAQALDWSMGMRTGRVPLARVRRVRLAYRPARMQRHRFVTEIWADGTPKLTIASISLKSMLDQQRLDKPYSAFVGELHRRLAAIGSSAHFEQGISPVIFWPGIVVLAGVSLVLAALIVRALQAQSMSGAIFVAVFLVLFLWRGGDFFHRNRPRLYRPDAPPGELLPGG